MASKPKQARMGGPNRIKGGKPLKIGSANVERRCTLQLLREVIGLLAGMVALRFVRQHSRAAPR